MSTNQGKGDHDLLFLYLTDIRRYPLLCKQDEQRLGAQIEQGTHAAADLQDGSPASRAERQRLEALVEEGQRAKRRLVQGNLRLVVSVAKHYQVSGAPLLDLIQDGNLGLLHAVERFDYRKGFKFSTYATWWIRQAIGRGLSESSRTIRLSLDTATRVRKVASAAERLHPMLGRPPTVAEIAADQELRVDQVVEALLFGDTPLSLSQALEDDGVAVLGDTVENGSADPADQAVVTLLADEIMTLLAPLHDRERRILWLRFGLDRGEPRTLEDVGEELHLTRERIRQIESRALSKLRHPSVRGDARRLLLG